MATDERDNDSGDFSEKDFFDEEDTLSDRPPPREPSQTAVQLADLAVLYNSFATEYGVAAGKVDRLPEAERAVYLAKLRKNGRDTLRVMAGILKTLH